MIEVTESGRALRCVVGGELVFEFAPLPAKDGMELMAEWVGAVNAFNEQLTAAPVKRAEAEADLAETLDAFTTKLLGDQAEKAGLLRASELDDLTAAVFLWQVPGGGLESARKVEQVGGGKARTLWLSGQDA